MSTKISDYYHKTAVRIWDEADVADREVTTLDSLAYNQRRMRAMVSLARDSVFDDFLMERLHATDYVYQQVAFGREFDWDYEALEDEINELDGVLVMLTLDDQTLQERMRQTLGSRARSSGASLEVPAHILDYDSNRRKRDSYLEFFEKSNVVRKFLFDTAIFTSEKIVEMVLGYTRAATEGLKRIACEF